MINAPATELSSVLEILNQSECIRKELLLETSGYGLSTVSKSC